MYTKHKLKFCEEIVTFNSSCVNDYKKKNQYANWFCKAKFVKHFDLFDAQLDIAKFNCKTKEFGSP